MFLYQIFLQICNLLAKVLISENNTKQKSTFLFCCRAKLVNVRFYHNAFLLSLMVKVSGLWLMIVSLSKSWLVSVSVALRAMHRYLNFYDAKVLSFRDLHKKSRELYTCCR